MSGLRIPRFVRLSAPTAGITHVISTSSPHTCILGAEVPARRKFAGSSRGNSPSPDLPWYVALVCMVVDSH